MSIIAIIPARSGSKRIPNKNVRPFAGLPMVAHSIRAARDSGLFDRIIVSTDSDEIAAVAVQQGAEVPFRRPAELANDFAPVDAVALHALQWLAEQKQQPDYCCCIYATAPFVRAEDIRNGLELLKSRQATSAISVCTYTFTIFRSVKINERGRIEFFWPENRLVRSQDLPEAFHDAAHFFWADVPKYLVEKRHYSSDTVPVVIPRYLVQDIDTPEDWAAAELLFDAFHARKTPPVTKPAP